jgi:hypothetical protein
MNPVAIKITRITLGTVEALVALNAFGGGVYGLLGARGVPKEWLDGTPFSGYFIPSLILFCIVGGASLVAAIYVLSARKSAKPFSIAGGLIILAWIGTQVAMIGYVSWLQPAVVVAGFLILFLALSLPPRAA